MEFSRCTPAPESPAKRENAARLRGLSKLSSDEHPEVDVFLGELGSGRKSTSIKRSSAHRSKSSGIP
jgi:hypothetical protein